MAFSHLISRSYLVRTGTDTKLTKTTDSTQSAGKEMNVSEALENKTVASAFEIEDFSFVTANIKSLALWAEGCDMRVSGVGTDVVELTNNQPYVYSAGLADTTNPFTGNASALQVSTYAPGNGFADVDSGAGSGTLNIVMLVDPTT
tara:strand:+ start:9626 stop:10063 length:438 start_codon:yes stop_codon:yes gene_type:complete